MYTVTILFDHARFTATLNYEKFEDAQKVLLPKESKTILAIETYEDDFKNTVSFYPSKVSAIVITKVEEEIRVQILKQKMVQAEQAKAQPRIHPIPGSSLADGRMQ